MTTESIADAPGPQTAGAPTRWLLSRGCTLMALLVVAQAAFAGQVLAGANRWLVVHEVGSHSIVLLSVILAATAIRGSRKRTVERRTAALVLLVPVLVAAQAYAGYARLLPLHLPLGVALALLCWVLARQG